jgi:hypothetical protein
MEFHPLDRKWIKCVYQSLVKTWVDTAMDAVRGRNSGPEFWIGVQEQTQTDIDYP